MKKHGKVKKLELNKEILTVPESVAAQKRCQPRLRKGQTALLVSLATFVSP